MSGGSYNYICFTLENECEGRMYDAEMNDMVKDFAKVLHALEWWQSGDWNAEDYRKAVNDFKEKWFKGDRTERLRGYVDSRCEELKAELYNMIGE